MAWWLTIYCTQSVAQLDGAQLLRGIQDQDPLAPAGVDYATLAEDYGVSDEAAAAAVANLRTAPPDGAHPLDVALRYLPDDEARPVQLHCWTTTDRVAEEVEECREGRSPPKDVGPVLDDCKEIIGIELGGSQLGTMAVVLAYEVARYLAQKGDGAFVDDDDEWFAVHDGAFVDP